MRTTVTLDSDVLRLLQDEMHRTRTSFKQSLNQVLRRALAPQPPKARKRFRLRAGPVGLQPGLDETRLGQLADQLEDMALLERMRRAEAAEILRQARAQDKRQARK